MNSCLPNTETFTDTYIYICTHTYSVYYIYLYRYRYVKYIYIHIGHPGGTVVKNLPVNAGDIGDTGLIPGWGGSHGVAEVRHD